MAWGAGAGLDRPASAKVMDTAMRAERWHVRRMPEDARRQRKALPIVTMDELADGAMVEADGEAFLYTGGRFLKWSFDGYVPSAPSSPMRLLTPPSVNDAFAAGFAPILHPTAGV